MEGLGPEFEKIGELIRRFLGDRGREGARRPGPAPDAMKRKMAEREKQRLSDAKKREILERLKKRRDQERRRLGKRGKKPFGEDSGF
jgi:hypothetical protein